ncbi:MAG: hypothetical protein ACKV0T_09870 [Planctomycetales bacterium]
MTRHSREVWEAAAETEAVVVAAVVAVEEIVAEAEGTVVGAVGVLDQR